jgi:VCBS repeat-containing protein
MSRTAIIHPTKYWQFFILSCALLMVLIVPRPAFAAVTDITLSNAVVDENAASGTAVGTLQAANTDPAATHTFLLVGGDVQSFYLDGALVRTQEVFDHETQDSYRIWVKATDNYGHIWYKELTVFIGDVNEAPVIDEGASTAVTMSEDGQPTPFNLTLHVTDPDDGDTISWAVSGQAGHGTAAASGSGESKYISYTPFTNYNGSDSFTVQVTDGGGLQDSIEVDVTLNAVNDYPTARDDSVTTAEETQLLIRPLNNDNDLDGDSFSLNSALQPAHGAISTNGDEITYTPDADFVGKDTLVYSISDGVLTDFATINIYVTNVNDPPTIDQSEPADVTCSEDNSPTPFSLTLTVSDIDSSSFSWAILTAASHGTAAVSGNGTGTVSYTPDAHYNGGDSFVVQVSDGKQSDTITVNVTVEAVNDAPVGADDSGTTTEETPVMIDVLANDSDVVEGGTISLVDAGSPVHGVASIFGGQIRYTPNNDFNGSDIFVYTFTDNGTPAATATATVVISVSNVNDAPVIGIVEEVVWNPVGVYGFSNPAFKGDLAGLAR